MARSRGSHIHLLGIGGTGMTALAGLLHQQGCRVTGADGPLYPPTSTILEHLGVEVYHGYDPAHLDPAPDLVVIGNAISRGNAELEAVLDAGLDYRSMPQTIAERFLVGRHSMVVSGTHGKTTTSSMLATVLATAGRDPSFLIGGVPLDFGVPYRLGRGEEFVIEGDEYDTAFFDKGPKFMHYRPRTVLLGTVEFDHADIFADLEAVRTAFRRLINLIPRSGLLACHMDSPVVRELADGGRCRVEGYGFEHGWWRAVDLVDSTDGVRFRVLRDGRAYARIEMQVPGKHNALNALSVVVAAADRGLAPAEIARGLAAFRGVRRRLERRADTGGVLVLDDFAHHPTAIANMLEAVRRAHGGRRIWAVLEPRSWSLRRNVFQTQLAAAFDHATKVVVARVYGEDALAERERLDPVRLVADLTKRGRDAVHLGQTSQIVEHLVEGTRRGDVIVVMSNGGFDGLLDKLIPALEARGIKAS
ncbi:MAG TPA: UDP-N-acetylmuramate:L-alanyl-gamma-D-glutamyl-meso-diaminopimelate ligase [Candidatus Polarisedimenticolaceae bacterium]|nr:UDP-N-acetylmuramate:L-alanyl-gamma-D-glutamyl-meso-diaminopimelate ligase [Candidatus Polarisedimenticolaceae bacterium]